MATTKRWTAYAGTDNWPGMDYVTVRVRCGRYGTAAEARVTWGSDQGCLEEHGRECISAATLDGLTRRACALDWSIERQRYLATAIAELRSQELRT